MLEMDPRTSVIQRLIVLVTLLSLSLPLNLQAAQAPFGSPLAEEAAYWERLGSWKDLRVAVDSQDRERAKVALTVYLRELEQSGVSSEKSVLVAASVRARQAARLGEYERSRLWLEIAEKLDPNGARVHSARLEVGIQESFSGWFLAPGHLLQMVHKGFGDPASRMGAWALLGLIGSLALSLAAIFFLSACAMRKLPYLRHRLDHWAIFPLPGGVFQVWAFAAVLIALSLGNGLLPPLLVMTAILAVFHSEKDRFALVLLLVALGALPAMSHWFWSYQGYEASGMHEVERCEEGNCAFFKDQSLEWPMEAESHYGKGLMHLRKADLIGAEAELKAARSKGLSDMGLDVALGNVMLLRLVTRCPHGALTPDLVPWVKDALEHFTSALEKDAEHGAVQYGLALSERLLGHDQRALSHFERFRASREAEPEIFSLSQLSICPERGKSMIGTVRWTGLTKSHREDVAQRMMKARGIQNIVPYQEWMLGSMHAREMALCALVLALFILLLSPSISRVLGSGRCTRCSDLFCTHCASTEAHVRLCQKCLMDRLQIAIADPQDVWRRQVGHDRRLLLLGRWVLVLGLIFPGFGSVLRGRMWRGIVLLLLASLGFVLVLGATDLLAGWPSYSGSASWTSYAPAIWVLIPTYIWGGIEARLASRVELT